jgi:hypothetical protein
MFNVIISLLIHNKLIRSTLKIELVYRHWVCGAGDGKGTRPVTITTYLGHQAMEIYRFFR